MKNFMKITNEFLKEVVPPLMFIFFTAFSIVGVVVTIKELALRMCR